MSFLSEYGLFLLKLFTGLLGVFIATAVLAGLMQKNKKSPAKLTIKKLNKQFEQYQTLLFDGMEDKSALNTLKKLQKKSAKAKNADTSKLFVLSFQGDIKASALNSLREEITAILLVAKPKDSVLIRLESPGGMVHAYGLAAAQLTRIKTAGLKLIICVDKVAASGGYLMAAVADHLIAAPFAFIGSIGVVLQLPNFHHYLKKKHIDFEQITAGEYKRPLSLFGENTDKGREKAQEEVNETLDIFKAHLEQCRPQLSLDRVATGEHWLGEKALQLGLIDELGTSDDYLLKASSTHEIYVVEYMIAKSWAERWFAQAH
jgi:serine protease SohB